MKWIEGVVIIIGALILFYIVGPVEQRKSIEPIEPTAQSFECVVPLYCYYWKGAEYDT